MGLFSDFTNEAFYCSSETSGFSFSMFNISSMKRIPQTSFSYNFGDIRRESITKVIEGVSLEGVSWFGCCGAWVHFGYLLDTSLDTCHELVAKTIFPIVNKGKMEAGGIEPPSERFWSKASTCLSSDLNLVPTNSQKQD